MGNYRAIWLLQLFWMGINCGKVLPCMFCCFVKAEKVPELLKVIEARPEGQEDEAMHYGATLVKWPGNLKQELKDRMMAWVFLTAFTIFCWLRKGFQLVPVMGINGGLTVVKMIGDFFVFQHVSQPGIYHPTISSTFRIELFLSFKVVFQPHFGLFSVNFLACKSLYQ